MCKLKLQITLYYMLVQEIITDPWPIQGAQGCMVVLALLGQYKENKLGCPSNFGPTDSGGGKIQDGRQALDMAQLTFFLWDIKSK